MKSMGFSALKQSYWRWVFMIIFSFLVPTSFSDPRITNVGLFCGDSQPPHGTNYVPNFTELMKQLSNQMNDNHFASYHLNSTPPMYGLAQCHEDLDHTDCLLCHAEARTRIPRCLPRSARIFLDGCFLRYEYNQDFFHESVSPTFDTANCSSNNNATTLDRDRNSRMISFGRNVDHAVGNVTSIALRRNGFGVVGMDGVYALAQCWDSLTPAECQQCLQNASETVRRCVPNDEGRALNAGCYLRYSTTRFYTEGADSEGHHGYSIGVIIAIVLASSAFVTLSVSAAYVIYARLSKRKRELKSLGWISKRFDRLGLMFKYETLEKATDYFSPSRKLGQGGAGSVFMGIFPDGRTVAVKRLIYNTRQWVDDFFNEVNLISIIQHKNLVKLLGASIEGPESLLVYEYVPNKSLDQFLFDEEKSKLLNWKQRFNIIVGIAEGLAHLHGGGSHVRIIHRDIKSSNVLLDENLNPKIADFGLVRCLGTERSHLSTGIAGTLGYMAPEYLVRGQLSEKADVYSFGVLVIEIVCGKKNSSFTKSGSLLQTVWTLHKTNALAAAVDLSIRDEMSVKQAPGVLQIGLLCTQASVLLRPSMAEVIQMLTDKDYEIPMPNQPPFLNANVLGTATSSGSYSTNSFMSNALRKIQGSGTSSESSGTR
ncbi:Cysteine-rich receptor-like protein kinase 42 [Hibiscus syriacus]|uniref:Cysteine-rich receptor-like protein kinase 42 n=2 Tax=Hibiscus syriacus TaxID=106335 RepID=A0A6A2ZYH4_HIBSY|nr:Cysteine-rich receptor-like protein kinase 42 [Hibiscus syriacus]